MTMTTRLLAVSDLPAITEILASRTHMLSNTPIFLEHMSKRIADEMEQGVRFTGCFLDDVLDGFICWKPIGQAPRADDLGRSEPAAIVDHLWTRGRSGREKIATGDAAFPFDDVGVGHLMNAVMRDMEEAGVFTYVAIVPTQFRAHHYNKVYSEDQGAKRVVTIGATAPAGGFPDGPVADFMRGLLRGHAAEDLTYRIHTVLDEHRP